MSERNNSLYLFGMTKYGYARSSTLDQTCISQLAQLTKEGVRKDKVFIDEGRSTRLATRPQLENVLNKLKPGDTLVVASLDRLGRTVTNLIQLMERLQNAEIHFVSLKQRIDTSDAVGTFLFHMFASLAQMERDLIRERTLLGLQAAREAGKTFGRKKVLTAEQVELAQSLVDSGQSVVSIARAMNVSRQTIYRAIWAKE
jgi:DNA invertase Pin-like site-specific DNA recombinase